MKRKIALLLAMLMMLTLLPTTAFAAPNDKLIALTFDDGPALNTKRLLDGLRARGVKCTFFLVGTGVEYRPELVKQMWLDGHEIASHTYDHPALTSLSDSQIKAQLKKNDGLIDKALGFDQSYMLRPPYGDYNSRVLKAAGVPCFYWSMDTYDWKTQNANSVYNEFIKQARDGSLALLHDTHSTSVDAALRAIDTLKARGYQFVTVSEMFYRRGINLQAGKIYFDAYPGSYGTADAIKKPVIKDSVTDEGKQVTINGDSRGQVYYTTNGEYPTPANSKLYTGPFAVSKDTTVKAISVIKWNGLRSDVTSAKIKYTPADTPIIDISEGMVTMTCKTNNSDIYYTTDGSTPTTSSAKFEEGFEAVADTTYRARAYAPGYDTSAVATLTLTKNGNLVSDVTVSSWYYEEADRLMTDGLIKGMSDREFAPNLTLSRAMLVTILHRMSGAPDVSGMTEPFGDVSDSFWGRDSIAWAYNNGIIKGYEDGSFKPNKAVSRQELCTMLARYMRFAGKDLSEIEGGVLGDYKDCNKVGDVFADDVDLICSLGIVRGFEDNTLRPAEGATRAQAAVMICRMLDAMAELPDVQPDEPVIPDEPIVPDKPIETDPPTDPTA